MKAANSLASIPPRMLSAWVVITSAIWAWARRLSQIRKNLLSNRAVELLTWICTARTRYCNASPDAVHPLKLEVLDAEAHPKRDAAVDDHVLTRDVAGIVGSQEQHHLGDVVGRAPAAQRNSLQVIRPRHRILDQRRRQPRVDDSGVDGVDADLVPGQVEGRVAHEGHDSALRRAVRNVQLFDVKSIRRSKNHHRAPSGLRHRAARLLGGQEDPSQVHIEDPPPRLLRKLEQRLELDYARRVYEDVEVAEAIDCPDDSFVNRLAARDISARRLHRISLP